PATLYVYSTTSCLQQHTSTPLRHACNNIHPLLYVMPATTYINSTTSCLQQHTSTPLRHACNNIQSLHYVMPATSDIYGLLVTALILRVNFKGAVRRDSKNTARKSAGWYWHGHCYCRGGIGMELLRLGWYWHGYCYGRGGIGMELLRPGWYWHGHCYGRVGIGMDTVTAGV
ncbi:hypothetical protein LSAT2_006276, partial [Lamellibrachia satsuma]